MTKTIQSNELEKIHFQHEDLYGIRLNHGHHDNSWDAYVAVNSIIDALGLDRKGQRNRINRDPVLSSVRVMMTSTASDGKQYEMLMLPIDYINGWLFGIDANRVKPELKEKIIAYQKECYRVLADHFTQRERYDSREAKGAVRKFEAYWFKRFPHWKAIRTNYLNGFPFKQIAEFTGKCERTCRKAVKSMENKGLINPRQAASFRSQSRHQYDMWRIANPCIGW